MHPVHDKDNGETILLDWGTNSADTRQTRGTRPPLHRDRAHEDASKSRDGDNEDLDTDRYRLYT
jgi:hypothetical protein